MVLVTAPEYPRDISSDRCTQYDRDTSLNQRDRTYNVGNGMKDLRVHQKSKIDRSGVNLGCSRRRGGQNQVRRRVLEL